MVAVNNSRVALGVERVEDRLVLSATVDVTFAAGALVLTGDNNADNFEITQVVVGHGKSAVHELQISGDQGTKLISSNKSLTVDSKGDILVPTSDVVRSVAIRLGTGDNDVSVANLTTLAPSALSISDGNSAGNNSVQIHGVQGKTALIVALGTGNDSLRVAGSNLASVSARLSSTSQTSDKVHFRSDNVTGATSITTGAGNDRVVLAAGKSGSTYGGAVRISLGAGNDTARIDNATFNSTLRIDGVSGKDVATGAAHITKTNLTVVNATNHIHVT